MERVRIRKGVRPFGGRIVEVAERMTYPNGRAVVLIVPPSRGRGRYGAQTIDGAAMHVSLREYDVREVEALD